MSYEDNEADEGGGQGEVRLEVTRTLLQWVRNAGVLGGFLAFNYIADQDGWLKDVWAQAKTAGAYGCLLATMFLIQERKDRKKAEDRLYNRTITMAESNNRQTAVAEKGAEAMKEMTAVLRLVAERVGLDMGRGRRRR